jgi:hypothetical protein
MNSLRAQNRPPGSLGPTDESSWLNDVAAPLAQGGTARADGHYDDLGSDVTCDALNLALSAIQIHIAWHAGVISAEAAMDGLDRAIAKSTSRCAGLPATGSHGASNRSSSSETVVGSRRLAEK